jgi:hypothetical protein
MLPNSNSNRNPSTRISLLLGTYISNGLNIAKEGYVFTLSIYSLISCRPSYAYCCCFCCYCKWCCKWWKCYRLVVVSIQSSYTSSSNCICSSPSRNLVSCSLLTSWLYSLSFFSCGNVICSTSYLCSLNYFSYGDVIYGTSIVCLAACTIVGTTRTIVAL